MKEFIRIKLDNSQIINDIKYVFTGNEGFICILIITYYINMLYNSINICDYIKLIPFDG